MLLNNPKSRAGRSEIPEVWSEGLDAPWYDRAWCEPGLFSGS